MKRSSLASLVSMLGCSTLAPLPDPVECVSDEDCPAEDQICAPDTSICVPSGNVPPLADLGFDIQELVGGQVVYRAEVGGCDREMEVTQSRLGLNAQDLEQTFELEVFVANQVDPPMTDPSLLRGAIELSQPSRFARGPLVPPRIDYPTVDATTEVPTVLPTSLRWPRYHPDDVQPPVLEDGGFVLWRSIPETGAPVLQMLAPPQFVPPQLEDFPDITTCTSDTQCCRLDDTGLACDEDDPNFCVEELGLCTAIGNPRFKFSFTYDDRCSRNLIGDLDVVDAETLAPLDVDTDAGVSLRIRHADTPGPDIPRLGVYAIGGTLPDDRAFQCSTDDDCIAGEQFCDTQTEQCMLALAGRTADSGSILTGDNGSFATYVYTYCDPENVGFVRSFTISATPPGPLASLSYTVDASFSPIGAGGFKPDATIARPLCVPDWGASVPLSLELTGKPVVLLGSGADEYACCDVGCLPASPDVASSEPTQLDTCDGTTAGAPEVTVSANLVLDLEDLAAWDDAGCQPPDSDGNGVVGGIRRTTPCTETMSDATCVIPDLAAGKDGSAREYDLRLESPVGSLFQSMTATIGVEPTAALQKIELLPRVLVRGRVVLDALACQEAAPVDGDCGSEGALVRAERLRMPGESDATEVGPYFHEVPTYFDPTTGRKGGYVLPLDPGVYLLTALPLSGSRGGPAEITVIDLHDVDSMERDLELSSGQLVTLDLTGFDPRAQIVPLDRGSWRNVPHLGRLDDPDPLRRNVDLNATGECLQPADETPQACRIRRLISGASLSASQVGQVRFTARIDEDVPSCSSE